MSADAGTVTPARRAELADGLARVRDRVAAAERAAGRPPGDVRLVVVTKFFPVSDVVALLELGVDDIGESRDDEAAAKVASLAEIGARPSVHFVGQVQSRKAASVAGYADLVHSVDRAKLVTALDRGAQGADRVLPVLVQVDLDPPTPDAGDGSPSRGGVSPQGARALADAVAQARGLRLRGVMGIAPLGAPPAPAFARLAELGREIAADHPGADVVSAGMSGDLEDAVAAGATLVRVGSAILGPRPPRG
ncbi:YggS family pyridoxal phosphate-dependent enzyme [Agilicoccus flavus]|uniref:YggS family pyridoxal phosphate-dependent enzyme n=1 Tax=Agilicoccus flavus TaxID=2775968 RepID=UPI001CF6A2E3|nr:YggS family pyridoxal phosphate-dependent enzyme [Agilicoccus flavus]